MTRMWAAIDAVSTRTPQLGKAREACLAALIGAAIAGRRIHLEGCRSHGAVQPHYVISESYISNVAFDIEEFDIECSFDIDVLHLRYRMSISKVFDIEGLLTRYRGSQTFDIEGHE